jgi:hypothetical protein
MAQRRHANSATLEFGATVRSWQWSLKRSDYPTIGGKEGESGPSVFFIAGVFVTAAEEVGFSMRIWPIVKAYLSGYNACPNESS